MIRINQVKIRAQETDQRALLAKKAAGLLRVRESDIQRLVIVRQSIDARKKPDIFYSYTLDVSLYLTTGKKPERDAAPVPARTAGEDPAVLEERIVRKAKNPNISRILPVKYVFPASGTRPAAYRPVIIGTGPAGLFCGYFLAKAGYAPILLERGADVDGRMQAVERFWKEGILDPNTNVQFGEGGAGTFSDGKLNTLVKDKYGRNGAVLETFVRFGAKESILYEAKPHLGTDALCGIVKRMRQEIERLGGEVRFGCQVTALQLAGPGLDADESFITAVNPDKRVTGVIINGQELLPCNQAVLAIGHSARDTMEELYAEKIPMEAKSFAVGLRVEHPQAMINQSQYGMEQPGLLGAAPYKVAAQTSLGRGVYSFCMCPGGYVVNASSEPGRLAVNGMSYSGRNGQNANSAIIVSVTPEDFGSDHPLAGIAFQRELEERAYKAGQGKIPVQRYGEFKARVESAGAGNQRFQEGAGKQVEAKEEAYRQKGVREEAYRQERIREDLDGTLFSSQNKGGFRYADVSRILPEDCNRAFVEGMTQFGRLIPGFDGPDALLSGVESRTSSPVRIQRNEALQSPAVRGLYPCGEGAGYAGGITSAAMDGIRVAEMIAAEYAPYQGTTGAGRSSHSCALA